MKVIICNECDGTFREMNKVITTVDQSNNYEMKKAKLHICDECGKKVYLEI